MYFCRLKYFAPLLVFVFVWQTLSAQDPLYIAIDKANGLPSNTVYDLFEDQNGFIWIGHDKGLSRYDGRKFVHFNNDQQNGKALTNILQDGQGKIWSQSFSGQLFYTSGDSLKYCSAIVPTGLYNAASIIHDSILFIADNTGVRRLNTETQQVSVIKIPTFSNNPFSFKGNEQYHVFNREKGEVTTIQTNHTFTTSPAPAFTHFYALHTTTGDYYVEKYPTGNSTIVKGDGKQIPFRFPDNTFVHNVQQVNDSTTAILTANGFYLFDENFQPRYGHVWFGGKKISCLLQDREGNGWAGTLNEGILFVPSLSTKRKFKDHSFSAIEVAADHSSIYLGTTQNELLQYNSTSGKLSLYAKQKLIHEVTAIHNNAKTNVVSFASDKVYFLKGKKELASFYGSIKDIEQLSTGEYVLATSMSTHVIALPGNKSRPWSTFYPSSKTDTRPGQMLNHEIIRTRAVGVLHDTIYSATSNTLMAYSPTTSWEVLYHNQPVSVSDIAIHQQDVYVSSFNKGIFKVADGKLSRVFLPADDTLSAVYKIAVSNNRLWALTEHDVRSYSLETGEVNIIDQSEGLPTDDIRDFALLNDTLYLAGNGLIYLPIHQKPTTYHPPRIVLNEIFVNSQRVNVHKPISLLSTQNDLLITYSVLAFKQLHHVKIYYQINKGNWESLENASRELRLPALSPGNYSVTIKVVGKNGLESVAPIHINFTIHKPFYKETWFVVVLILLLISVLYRIHLYRLKKLEEKNKIETDRLELEQALQQSLLASIKSQMNPHFIYNALSSIQSFVYADDKESAIKYLDNFSNLMRQVLEMSNRETILLGEELMILETYISLEKMRFGDSLQYSLYCDPKLDPEYIRLPSMIVQPFVENAIKHGLLHRKGEKKLEISFYKKGEHNLEIIVDDNGVGRKISSELQRGRKNHASFSTGANQTRLSLLNTKPHAGIGLTIIDKTDDLGQALGTRVIIVIPHVVS